ncbi:MAG: 30S ribosome-binding factor RbfA [Candidatus Omnitrophota bacterium]
MHRKDRLEEVIRKEMGRIVREELHDPRLGFVTITAVEMSDDLRYARIYYSVLGDEKQEKDTISAMNSARGFIRRLIAKCVDLRYAPDIGLKIDRSVKRAIEVEKVLLDTPGHR